MFFDTRPICTTYKRGENLVSANLKQPPIENEEFPRNVEASIRNQFDQEHKLPEEKRNSLGLTKFWIYTRHLIDSFR